MQFLVLAFAALAAAAPTLPEYGVPSNEVSTTAASAQPTTHAGSSSSGNSGSCNSGSGNSGSGDSDNGSSTVVAGSVCTSGWTPKCCQTDVLGLVGLTCDAPSSTPFSKDDFYDICSEEGSTASCCLIPVAGEGLICDAP